MAECLMKETLSKLIADVSNVIEWASRAEFVHSDAGNDLIQKGRKICKFEC